MYKGPTRKFKKRRIKRRQQKQTEYGQQLLEKQKLRKAYSLREKTLKNYFKKASRKKVEVDVKLIQYLERRLDNVVYRLGWSSSRPQGAQFVSHGHIMIGGKTVTIPSYQVSNDEQIEIKLRKKELYPFRDLPVKLDKFEPPRWLAFTSKDKMKTKVLGLPLRENFTEPINLSLVLQFYSR